MANAALEHVSDAEARRGMLFVWIAVIIFASANSIVLLLFDVGAQYPVDGWRNPISFCNVLFAGNVCACLTMIAVYRKEWTRENLSKITKSDWASLIFLAIITGALVPSLMFLALTNSTVTNTILVGRIEPLILIALSIFMLREKPDFWPTLGAVVCFGGVALTFFLESAGSGFAIGKGELQAAAAAAFTSLATVIAKVRLKNISLGIFTVVRTGLGAIIFFWVTVYLLTFEHFIDLTSPLLWQLMVIYGAVIVVGGQYCWFYGIKRAKTSEVSLASSFTPIAGVAFAFVLLGEVPSSAVLIGGVVIVLGIMVGQFPNLKGTGQAVRKITARYLVEREREANFKGV
ncbi:MAG: DMT family transporter [Pseudomonadota bacterium]